MWCVFSDEQRLEEIKSRDLNYQRGFEQQDPAAFKALLEKKKLVTKERMASNQRKIVIRSFFSTLECTRCYSSDLVVVSIKDGVEKVPERFCSGCGEKLVSVTSLDLGA